MAFAPEINTSNALQCELDSTLARLQLTENERVIHSTELDEISGLIQMYEKYREQEVVAVKLQKGFRSKIARLVASVETSRSRHIFHTTSNLKLSTEDVIEAAYRFLNHSLEATDAMITLGQTLDVESNMIDAFLSGLFANEKRREIVQKILDGLDEQNQKAYVKGIYELYRIKMISDLKE